MSDLCGGCKHYNKHFPPNEPTDDEGPLEGETWVCANPGCPCQRFVPTTPSATEIDDDVDSDGVEDEPRFSPSVRKQLIDSSQATPASTQPTKPCTDCPFARAALPGWLGGMGVDEWIAAAHSDSPMRCHVHPNVQCAGAAIYRGNVGKIPRDGSLLCLKSDRKLVFSNPKEFEAHHSSSRKP